MSNLDSYSFSSLSIYVCLLAYHLKSEYSISTFLSCFLSFFLCVKTLNEGGIEVNTSMNW